MDSPFLVGAAIAVAIFGVGTLFSKWSWAKPLAAASFVIAIIASALGLGLR